MAKSLGVSVAIGLVLSLGVAVSAAQTPEGVSNADEMLPGSTIEYIPPLARAILTGDPNQVAEAVKRAPDSVNEPVRAKPGARAGFTPLIIAAALSYPNIAGMLIQSGAKVSVLDDYHRSAVWYAALREDLGVTRVLVNDKAVGEVVNAADSDFKRTPLHLAVRGSDPEIVSLLISAGASKSRRDILGETPHDYCEHNPTIACLKLPN
jgi:hypothetical protein